MGVAHRYIIIHLLIPNTLLSTLEEFNLINAHENEQKIERLRIEHRDLDEVIAVLIKTGHDDEMRIQRLKKQKLRIRDQIVRLESKLPTSAAASK